MQRRAFIALLVSIGLLAAILGVLLFKTNPEVASKLTQQQLNRKLADNCRSDRRFRLQYKKRAEVERHFLSLYVRENKALAVVSEGAHLRRLTHTLKAVDKTARHLISTIHIIPVPDCAKEATT